jgi:hypothetical protein
VTKEFIVDRTVGYRRVLGRMLDAMADSVEF